MQGKIALEEHFAIPDTLMDSAGFVPDSTCFSSVRPIYPSGTSGTF